MKRKKGIKMNKKRTEYAKITNECTKIIYTRHSSIKKTVEDQILQLKIPG